MPDTSSISGLMPTAEEHAASVEELKKQLSMKIAEIDAEEFVSSVEKRKRESKAAVNNGSAITSQSNNGGGNADAGDEKGDDSTSNAPTTANEVIKNQLLF